MALNARLVVLVSTAELETLHRLAHDRGWPMSRMARRFLADGVRAELRREERKRAREHAMALNGPGEKPSIRSMREIGARDADS